MFYVVAAAAVATKKHQVALGGPSSNMKISEEDPNEVFDKAISEIGGFGRYQKFLLSLSIFASITAACNHLSPIYLSYQPKNIECLAFDPDQILDEPQLTKNHCRIGEHACVKWKYDTDVFQSTFVTQFDLVCERAPLLPTIASSYMSGVVVTNILMGMLSDHFGRRSIIITLSAFHIIASFITAFAVNYPMFVAFRFFVGGTIHAIWSSYFVLIIEMVPETSKSFCGGVLNFGWNIGSLFMTFLAFFIRNGAFLQLAFAVFSLSLLAFYFLIPESPRWLMDKGKHFEAKEILIKMADKNGVQLEQSNFENLFDLLISMKTETKAGKTTIKKMFTSKEYLKRLALMIPPWFAVGLGSYGIHFAVQEVYLDIFTATAVKEVIIMTIILLLIPIFKKMKRTKCVLTFFCLGGLVAMSYIIPDFFQIGDANITAKKAQVVIYMLAQGLIVGDFYLVDTFTPDIFSTDVRNFTFCLLDSISKIGTTISPFIIYVGTVTSNGSLPTVLFGAIMLLSSTTLLFAPETKDAPMAQKIEELKNHGRPSIFQNMKTSK